MQRGFDSCAPRPKGTSRPFGEDLVVALALQHLQPLAGGHQALGCRHLLGYRLGYRPGITARPRLLVQ